MAKKKVKTKGSLEDMAKVTDLDERTIQGAINVVEEAAGIEVEVPKENK